MPDSFMRIDPADFKVWDQPDSKVLDPRGAAPTSAPGLGSSPLPHLHRDSAHPFLHLHPGPRLTFGHTVVDGMDDKA